MDANSRKCSSSEDEENPPPNHPHHRRRSSILMEVQKRLHSHFMSTLALCSSVITMFYLIMSIFPYSGFMVMHLIPGVDHENAGLYAGVLASSFMVGRTFSAYPFGKIADIYGRKFVLVFSLIVSAIGSLAFGFSTSYGMAVAVRFLMGLGNGSMVVARTAISELAKGDKELESKGVGVLMSMVGYGMLISPSVGGLLSEPLRQYPNAEIFYSGGRFEDLLENFPFILPNLFAFILAVLSTFFVIFSVEETLPSESKRHWGLAGEDFVKYCYKTMCCCCRHTGASGGSSEILDGDNTTSVDSSSLNSDYDWDEDMKILDSHEFTEMSPLVCNKGARKSFTSALHRPSHTTCREENNEQPTNETTPLKSGNNKTQQSSENRKQGGSNDVTMKTIMNIKSTRLFLISYWVSTFASVSQSEAFPLFAMSKVGGLGFEETSIGLVGALAGLVYCFAQYIIFTQAMKRLGLVKSMRYGIFWANIPIILVPVSLYLQNERTQIIYLSLLSGITMVANSVFAGCNTIGANRTVDASQRATMNGMNSLGTSIGRGTGPIFAGLLVAFAMTSGVIAPEFGGWVVYTVLFLIGVVPCFYTWKIPETTED